MIYLATGVPRLLHRHGADPVATPREFVAMLGVDARRPTSRCWSAGWALRRTPREPGERLRTSTATRALWRETLRNSHALLAFFALSNADILVARNVLDAHQAGLYAGGLILVKAVLFLPQFVVVLAFPSMSDAAAARRTLFESLARSSCSSAR